MRHSIVVVILISLLIGGCSYTEMRKVWVGLNPDDVACASRAYVQTFAAPPDAVYCRVLEEILGMGASINKREDRQRFIVVYGFNAIYPGCIDTTEVGIIVRDSRTPGAAEVLVASDNTILGARVARDLFKRLAGLTEKTPDSGAEAPAAAPAGTTAADPVTAVASVAAAVPVTTVALVMPNSVPATSAPSASEEKK